MSVDRLVAEFARLSEAPRAVPRLRQFVNLMAARGLLLPQEPTDPPAPILAHPDDPRGTDGLSRIEDSASPSGLEAGLPELPETWRSARLVDMAEVSYGFAFDSALFSTESSGTPLIRIRDISHETTQAYYEGDFDPRYLVCMGDYLVGMDGEFNLRRWRGPKALLNQRVMRIRDWSEHVVAGFMALPLQIALDRLHGATSQTTVKHLSAKQVQTIILPVPPLAEQRRIMQKVDELMALCDQLEARQVERERRRDRLREAWLDAVKRGTAAHPDGDMVDDRRLSSVPRMVRHPRHVATMRHAALALAIGGQLATHDSRDGGVEEMLSREIALPDGYVRRRKIVKRPAVSSVVDLPNLPPSWVSCDIHTLYERNAIIDYADGNHGSLYPRGSEFGDEGVEFVTAKDLENGRVRWESCAHLNDQRAAQLTKGWAQGGDVLLTHNATVGRVARVEPDVGRFLLGTSVTFYRLNGDVIDRDFFFYLLSSPLWQDQLTRIMEQTTRNQVSIQKQAFFTVVIPPLPEQRRIVAALDHLMSLCDELERSLAERETGRTRALEAVLTEALVGADAVADVPRAQLA